MNKFVSTMLAATLAVGTAITGVAPAMSAPLVVAPSYEKSTDVQTVNHRDWHRRGFYRSGGDGYYNGRRGYRTYRRGYRRHNDFWFPAGAFVAGAIIGGALNDGPRYAPRRVYRSGGGSAHVQWCYNRYRSYDARSNTFQPYNGPRQQCWSPYS